MFGSSLADGEDVAPDAHTTRPGGQDGFTVIEVMVAVTILVVAVLGVAVVLQGSLSSSRTTRAREQATNIARDLVERSRQVPYADTVPTSAAAALRSTLASDAPGALAGQTFSVARRDTQFTVTVQACTIDDPSDGVGVLSAGGCAGTGTGASGATGPTSTAAALSLPSILGLPVTIAGSGSLLQTVCQVVGTDTRIVNSLTAALSSATPVSACPSTSPGTVAYDMQPDDLRRVRVDVSWTAGGRSGDLTQTTQLTNPDP